MDKLIYTASEAAKALGTDHGRVLKMLEAGEIPAYREGRNWKVPVTLLQKAIEDRAVRETAERRRNGQA